MDEPIAKESKDRKRLLRWGAWFCSANALVLLIVSCRFVAVMGFPHEPLARAFVVLSAIGHFTMMAMLPWLAVALVVLAWPRRGPAMAAGIIFSALLVITLMVDSLVFGLYHFHLNGMVWSLIRNGNVSEILPLSTNTLAVAVAIVVGSIVLETVIAMGVWKWTRVGKRGGRWVIVTAATVVVASQLMHVWASAVAYVPITRTIGFFPAYRPLTANRQLRRLGWAKERGNSALKYPASRTALAYPLEATPCQPPAQPLNVMIIAIDCWRFDMLNEQATPNLWEYSRRNIRFEHHSAAAATTRFGIFSLFYGLYGTYWHSMLAEQRGPVLLTELKRAQYQFAVYGSAPLHSPEFDRTVFCEIADRLPPHTPGSAVERDRGITRKMLTFLNEQSRQQSFFGFLFYDSTHAYEYPPDAAAPFQPTSKRVDHLKLNASYDPVPLRNRFLNALHFVDSLVGEVLKRLEQEDLLDSTVVLVTGDHGEEFNETGGNYWGHNNNFSRYQTQVPLIVHWPGRSPEVASYVTSHLDIAPTLMQGVLNCTVSPAKYCLGISLFDPTPRIPLIAGGWDRFAVISPGRIDIMFDLGYTENFDEDYCKISTPMPPKYIAATLEGLSRFHRRGAREASAR